MQKELTLSKKRHKIRLETGFEMVSEKSFLHVSYRVWKSIEFDLSIFKVWKNMEKIKQTMENIDIIFLAYRMMDAEPPVVPISLGVFSMTMH